MFTLARELNRLGRSVHLVCIDEEVAAEWRAETLGSASVVELSGSRQDRLSLVQTLWDHLARFVSGDDIVVLFSYSLAAGALLPRRWMRGRPRIVLDLHDTLTPGFGHRALAMCAYRLDRVVAVSNFTLSQLKARRSIGRVLTRPVALLDMRTLNPSPSPLRVGIVGRINRDKAQHLVIEACTRLDATLTVRGDIDNNSEEYGAEIIRLGARLLGDRFRLEEPRPWKNALDDIDALVVANEREPMGRTVLEAQLQGVTAVVPDRGGAAELVVDGATGLKYRAGDVQSLSEAIQSLTLERRMAMRPTARSHAAAVSDPERYAKDYINAVFN